MNKESTSVRGLKYVLSIKISYFNMSIVCGKGHVSTTVSARTGSCFSKYIFHFPSDGCYIQNMEKKRKDSYVQKYLRRIESSVMMIIKIFEVKNETRKKKAGYICIFDMLYLYRTFFASHFLNTKNLPILFYSNILSN